MIACPEPARLAAAASGEDLLAERHAADCLRCRRGLDAELALRALAARLPDAALPRARRLALEAAVLAAADHATPAPPRRPRARRLVLGLTAAALAAAALVALVHRTAPFAPAARAPLVGLPPRPAAPAPRALSSAAPAPPPPTVVALAALPGVAPGDATIVARGRARFVRRATARGDEVAVHDGALAIDATAAPRRLEVTGGGVRVRVDGAEVEVHARRGAIHSVQVFAGSVEIVSGGRTTVVTAGASWQAPPPPAAAATPAAAAPPAAAATPPPAAPPTATAFARGWTALGAGDLTAAAAAFDRATADPAVAEDARYWLAVTHARAHADAAAIAAFDAFLAAHPASPHAGDAHLALARLLATADPPRAAAHRARAAADADPRIRAAAATSAPARAPTAPAR